jgi:hypothetical protein
MHLAHAGEALRRSMSRLHKAQELIGKAFQDLKRDLTTLERSQQTLSMLDERTHIPALVLAVSIQDGLSRRTSIADLPSRSPR